MVFHMEFTLNRKSIHITESTDLAKKRKPRTSCRSTLKRHCGRSELCKALLFCKKLVHEVLKPLRSGHEEKRKGFHFDYWTETARWAVGNMYFTRTAAKIRVTAPVVSFLVLAMFVPRVPMVKMDKNETRWWNLGLFTLFNIYLNANFV